MASTWAPVLLVFLGVVAVSLAVAYLTQANSDAIRSYAMAEDARVPYRTIEDAAHALGEVTSEATEQACIARCAATDGCVASVYDGVAGTCALRQLERKDDATLFVRYGDWGYNKFPRRTLRGGGVIDSADSETASECKKRCDAFEDACHLVRFGTANGEGVGRCEAVNLAYANPNAVMNWRT